MRFLWLSLLIIASGADRMAAQGISFSNVPRINPRSSYNRVIGENPSGLYLLRMRNPDARQNVEVEWYSHNLNFQSSRYLSMGSGRLLRIFQTTGGLCYLQGKGDRSRGVFTVSGGKTDAALKDLLEKPRLLEFDHYDFYKDNTEAVQDRFNRYCALYADSRDGSGKQIIDLVVLDSSLAPVYRQVKTLEIQADAFRIGELALDPEGNAYILASEQRKDRRKGDPGSVRHVVYCFQRKMEAWYEVEVNEGLRFINHARMAFNDSSGRMVLTGLYGMKSNEGTYGVFSLHIDPANMGVFKSQFTPIDREFVAGIIGQQQESNGDDLMNFRVRKVICRSDEGMVLVAERYYVTQQVETFYVSGIPQTTTTNMYHYDDVMLLSLNGSGNIEWRQVIRKRQSGMAAASQYSGIAVCATPASIQIIYNDYSKTDGDVIQYSVRKDGFTEQRIIMRSENYFSAVIPNEGKQTGFNRMVLTCLRNRQVSLMKLAY